MPLDDSDWVKMGELFDKKLKPFADSITKLQGDMSHAGKRIQRLETGFDRLASASRRKIVDAARKDHDRLLRGMFDDAHLVALPPLIEDDPTRRFQRHQAKCLPGDVTRAIKEAVGDDFLFDVELAKPAGFRIILSSRSPQTRRSIAARIIKHAKDALKELELHIQYDKPFELREIQRSAHKFLHVVEKRGGAAITSKEVRQGYLVVNGFRLAPECLVPSNGRWDHLADLVKDKLRHTRSTTFQPEDGIMADVFGSVYAADHGVVSLDEIVLEDDEEGGPLYDVMQH